MREFLEHVNLGAGFAVGVICVLAAMKLLQFACTYAILELSYRVLAR